MVEVEVGEEDHRPLVGKGREKVAGDSVYGVEGREREKEREREGGKMEIGMENGEWRMEW